MIEQDLEKITKVLEERFQKFNILLKIRYDIPTNIENIMDKYWDNLSYYIEKEIPSSSSWIKDLDWKINGNSLTIFPTNDIVNYALENNRMDYKIKQKIIDEFNIDFNVYLDDSRIKDNGFEVIEQAIIEEKKISMETLNNNNHNNTTNSKKNLFPLIITIYLAKIAGEPMEIRDITPNTGLAIISGEIFQLETRDIRGNKKLVIFNISDFTDSMTVKVFLTEKQFEEFAINIKDGLRVKIEGDIIFDNYSKHLVLMLKSLNILEKEERVDLAKEKRVELHLHTQMSSMDGITSFKKLAKRAKNGDIVQ